jgi:hypothetical protein
MIVKPFFRILRRLNGSGRTLAMYTIPITIAAMRLGSGNYAATFGCKGSPIFAFDQQLVNGNAALVELALKCIAAKRADAAQTPCINMHPPLAVVLLIEQMNQFPGRTTIEIADWIDV